MIYLQGLETWDWGVEHINRSKVIEQKSRSENTDHQRKKTYIYNKKNYVVMVDILKFYGTSVHITKNS